MVSEEVNRLVSLDVGKFWGEIAEADEVKLQDIIRAGALKGHSTIFRESYHALNKQLLRKEGTTDEELASMDKELYKGNSRPYHEEFRKKGVMPPQPTREISLVGLENSVLKRGTTIRDKATSTGDFYQMAFGDRYIDFSSIMVQTDKGPKSYEELGPSERKDAEKMAVVDAVKRELNQPSPFNISYRFIEPAPQSPFTENPFAVADTTGNNF